MAFHCFDNLDIKRRALCPVLDFFKHFQQPLKLKLHTPEASLKTNLSHIGIHRPGLAMSGYLSVYNPDQIQMIGSTEWSYLESVGSDAREYIFAKLSEFRSPMWVLTHNLTPHQELLNMCVKQNVPLMTTELSTYDFAKETQRFLEQYFAAYTSVHASLVDVYGVGMLYVGDSNVGKSECVLDLVERGHRLVADDSVRITRIGDTVIGRSESHIKHHMEIRGIGIIDVKSMFGIKSVRRKKKIEVVIELQPWQQGMTYERTGLSNAYEEILGIKVPKVLIPVAPGKSLTVISEVIAMNALMKMNGVDVAKEFNANLLKAIQDKAQGLSKDDGFNDLLTGTTYE